jgi:AmmeMemoRadiSam system protein B
VERDTECVVLLGVNHHGMGARGALSPAEFWDTPLGKVAVERALEKDFQAKVEFLRFDDRAHIREHSIEVQIPFLQTFLRQFVVVPISLGRLVESECERLGGAVAEIYNAQTAAGKKTVLIASSDLNHYLSPEETERLDAMVIERVLALDPAGLLKTVAEKNISMCGVVPTAVLLFAANALSARSARLLKHCHSGDVVPMGEVVGYASVAVEL